MELFLAYVLLSVVVSINVFLLFKKSSKCKPSNVNYINRSLPRVHWYKIPIPWTNYKLPLPLPLEGYITMLKIRKEGVKMLDLAMQDYGTAMFIPFAYLDVLLITDVEHVKKLLNSNTPEHLNKPNVYELIFTKPGIQGLFGAEYNVWSAHRKIIGPAAMYKGFSTYVKFMNKEAQVLANQACVIADGNSAHQLENKQLKHLIGSCLVNIITNILMGTEDTDVGEEARARFYSTFDKYITLAMDRYLHPHEFIPIVWKFHPRRRKMDEYTDIINAFSDMIANKYRQKIQNQLNGNNDADKTQKDLETGVKPFQCIVEQMIRGGLTNTEIIDEINTFLGAGFETINASLDMLIFHLASNPDCQEKCYQEICQVLEYKQDDLTKDITMDNLTELKYLERCALESMRITPTVPYVLRRLDAPLEIGKDTYIEGNTVVLYAPWAVHRNPDIYPNPDKFDPDRFLAENVKLRHTHAYLPFSLGPRNCVGWKIAMLELKMIMAWILKHFKITTEDKLDDVKLVFDITIKPERLYNVTFTRR